VEQIVSVTTGNVGTSGNCKWSFRIGEIALFVTRLKTQEKLPRNLSLGEAISSLEFQ